MRFSDEERKYLEGFFSNLSVILVGLALTDQPLMGLPMTWALRGAIIGVGVVPLLGGLALERVSKEDGR